MIWKLPIRHETTEKIVYLLIITAAAIKLGWDARLPMLLLFAIVCFVLVWRKPVGQYYLPAWLLPGSIAFLLVMRLLPLMHHPAPLGYDTGLYRGLQQTYVAAMPHLPDFVPNSLPSLEFVGVHLASDLFAGLDLPPDVLLYGMYVLTQLLLAAALFITANEFASRRVGVLAVILYSLSAVLFGGYEFMLLKNFFALPFMLLALVFLHRRSWLSIPTIALLAGTHLPTFAVFSLTWLGFLIFGFRRRFIFWAYVGGILVALPMLVLNEAKLQSAIPYVASILIHLSQSAGMDSVTNLLYGWFGTNPQVTNHINSELKFSPILTGIFLQLREYIVVAAPFIVAAAAGFVVAWRDRRTKFLAWGLLMTGMFVAAGLIFQNRLIIHLDVFVVLLAAVGIDAILTRLPPVPAVAGFMGLCVVLLGSLVVQTMQSFQPLISRRELTTVNTIGTVVPSEAFLLTVSSQHAPWLYGYTKAKVIAPGMFEYTAWKKNEWDDFINTVDASRHRELLSRYRGQIYLYLTAEEQTLPFLDDPAFEQVGPSLFKYRTS